MHHGTLAAEWADAVVISFSAASRTSAYLRDPPTQQTRLLMQAASSYREWILGG